MAHTAGLAIQSIRSRIRTCGRERCGRWIGSLVKEVKDVNRVGFIDDSIVIDICGVGTSQGGGIADPHLKLCSVGQIDDSISIDVSANEVDLITCR